MSDVGTLGRVEPRRKWTGQEKAALLAEVEAAYARIMNASEAAEAARETMDPSHPIVPGRPASFSDGLLDLLAELSDDVARRVRIARGQR